MKTNVTITGQGPLVLNHVEQGSRGQNCFYTKLDRHAANQRCSVDQETLNGRGGRRKINFKQQQRQVTCLQSDKDIF